MSRIRNVLSRIAVAASALAVLSGAVAAQVPAVKPRPLVIIDGVSFGALDMGVDNEFLKALSPAIQSVEVIKGPAAVERYGATAKDGVILVQLKEATREAPRPTAIEATVAQRVDEPLVILDGVVMGAAVLQDPERLNALQIESVEVVKGAAAARLYGARASAGVIIIKTRR